MLTVFGSVNLDISIRVPRLPAPGETLLGAQAIVSPGGKGANQAHAARLFGTPTHLVGAVGRDAFADGALARLRQAGVDLSAVQVLDGAATGMATIAVSDDGANSIVVSPGANRLVEAAWVSEQHLSDSRLLLLQMEVPVAQSMQLARRAKAAGCAVMLNGAPMVEPRAIEPACIDWLVVNEIELAQLVGVWHGPGTSAVAQQAAWLARQCSWRVVVTLGAQGVTSVDSGGRVFACPASPSDVVDTTGAGDTFTGVFAAALVEGVAADHALRCATVAAGLACRHHGAQIAQPSRHEIDAALRQYALGLLQ